MFKLLINDSLVSILSNLIIKLSFISWSWSISQLCFLDCVLNSSSRSSIVSRFSEPLFISKFSLFKILLNSSISALDLFIVSNASIKFLLPTDWILSNILITRFVRSSNPWSFSIISLLSLIDWIIFSKLIKIFLFLFNSSSSPNFKSNWLIVDNESLIHFSSTLFFFIV